MCLICRGLINNKLTVEQAQEKYQEFLDLDLLDEDHQEAIECLIADAFEERSLWEDVAKAAEMEAVDEDLFDQRYTSEAEEDPYFDEDDQ